MDEFGKDTVMKSLVASPIRIARPSHDLRAAERFWVEGLGLDVLFRADDSAEGGHVLVMVGWPGAAWSTRAAPGSRPATRTGTAGISQSQIRTATGVVLSSLSWP
jgi:hypothetical protein